MAHPSTQLAANSPKKTPQSTPAKTVTTNPTPAEEVGAATTPTSLESTVTNPGFFPFMIPKVPVMQKFGCLRVYRMSSLLLSMGC